MKMDPQVDIKERLKAGKPVAEGVTDDSAGFDGCKTGGRCLPAAR